MFTTLLFDIDGVMLSEERYFDASALTIHELFTSELYLGLDKLGKAYSSQPTEEDIRQIRRDVFVDDRTLQYLKNVGVNANWDMVYLVLVSSLLTVLDGLAEDAQSQPDLLKVLSAGWTASALRQIGDLVANRVPAQTIDFRDFTDFYSGCTSRSALFTRAQAGLSKYTETDGRQLWEFAQQVFQEWYLGDDYTGSDKGKHGFLRSEYPLVDPTRLSSMLARFQQSGLSLGIATGRPWTETEVPLRHFEWWPYFESRYITTATQVLAAERAVPDARPLSKPHPFSYLRSLTGESDARALLGHPLPLVNISGSVLVVGDSIADALAAKSLGASFAAVLTGLEGQDARPKFERLGAEYILENVLELESVVG